MDQKKIGKFISELRKERNMTQLELSDKLGVSDRTISKWENGRGMPDVSLFESLCQELNISVNELLSGERIDQDKYVNCAEKNLMILTKQIEKRKRILRNSQKMLLFFAVCLFVSNMIFNSMYGDNWDRSNLLYLSYILMTINFGIAVTISFLSFDKK